MGSHVFVGPDGGLAGLVGSVVGFGFGRLVSSFVGAGGVGLFLARPGLFPVPLVQERPLAGGLGMDTGGRRSRGVTNSFHVSVNVSRVGMGLGNGRPVAAV